MPPTAASTAPPTVACWSPVCRFRVDGQPKGQPRPRAFAKRIGKTFAARVYDAGTAEGWKGCIAIAAKPHLPREPLAGPLRVDATFLMPRPQSLCRRCDPDCRLPFTGKPDRDNLDKALLDCLTQLGLWGDDAQAFAGTIEKWYAAKGERPGAAISVWRWTQTPAATTAARPPPVARRATRTGTGGLWDG